MVGQVNKIRNTSTAGTGWFALKGSGGAFMFGNQPMKRPYVYLLKDKNGSYYVGKGRGSRWMMSRRERGASELRFQHFCDSEDEAFRLEDKIWCEMVKRGFKMLNRRRPERRGRADERSGSGQRFIYQGKCLTLSEWAPILGIRKSTLYGRYHVRMPVERLLSPELPVREVTLLTLDGVTKTIGEWSLTLGIRTGLIRGRIGRGWSVEKTLTTPTKRKPILEGA